MKKINILILCLFSSLFSYAISPISGATSVCVGTTTGYFDGTTGGTWSSGNVAVGTVDPVTGLLTAVSAGTTMLSYTVGAADTTYVVTVHPIPAGITGSTTICSMGLTALSDGTLGGLWYSSNTSVATVTSTTGFVTGVASGSSIITYDVSGCVATVMITVDAPPAVITGTSTMCAGSGVTLSDATGGGVWTSENVGVASVGATTGIVAGVASGYDTIVYTVGACAVYYDITINALPTADSVTGGGSYCSGGSGEPVGLSGSQSGISYTLYRGGVVVGSSLVGTGTSLSFGLQTIAGTYTIEAANPTTGCTANMTGSVSITINPLPAVYTVGGGGSYCAGGTGVDITLLSTDVTDTYWLMLSGTMVSSITGTGSSISFAGVTTGGAYTIEAVDVSTGCLDNMTGSATVVVTPTVTPTVTISAAPGDTVCSGTSVTYTATVVNGGTTPTYAWYVNSTLESTTSFYYVYPPSTGDEIDLVVTSDATCAMPATVTSNTITMVVTTGVTVSASATAAACGGGVTLAATGATDYSWEPTTGLSCPTCASTSATISGTTTYTVTGTIGSCGGSDTVTVNGNRIYGNVSFGGITPDTLDMKVWLIQFSATDSSIQALDSTYTCLSGGSPYFEFDNEAAGNYLVKGELLYGNPAGASGYIPSYGANTTFWYAATNVAHSTGADNQNIEMVYGTVPTGPGFIGGLISSGAGRGTSGTMPAAGMIVYLRDAATNHVLTFTYTDNSGAYSFSGIANGNYLIYPENFDDYTTPSSIISVTATNESINGINFVQRTTSRTIVPINPESIKTINSGNDIVVYPNPAAATFTIQWQNQSVGTAQVTLTDMMGRQVLNQNMTINSASGMAQLSTASIGNGMYFLSVTSGNSTYNTKLQILN